MNAGEVATLMAAAEAAGRPPRRRVHVQLSTKISEDAEMLRSGQDRGAAGHHSSFTLCFSRDPRGTAAKGSQAEGPSMTSAAIRSASLFFCSGPCLGRHRRGASPSGHGVDHATEALLEFPGAARPALCESSFEAQFLSHLNVWGSEGLLRLDRAFSAKDFEVAIQIIRGTDSTAAPRMIWMATSKSLAEKARSKRRVPFNPTTPRWLWNWASKLDSHRANRPPGNSKQGLGRQVHARGRIETRRGGDGRGLGPEEEPGDADRIAADVIEGPSALLGEPAVVRRVAAEAEGEGGVDGPRVPDLALSEASRASSGSGGGTCT